MVQSTSLSGNRVDEGEYYRFAVNAQHDFHVEVDLPPEDVATVTPVVVTTDTLHEQAYFTWDTEHFVHRFGLASQDLDNEKSFLVNYHKSFNQMISKYITSHDDDFFSGETYCDILQDSVPQGTEIVCRQEYLTCEQFGEIEIPILTTYMYVGATRFAIRSIPVVDSDFWLLPMFSLTEEAMESEAGAKVIAEWKAISDLLLEEVMPEVSVLLKSLWVQEGAHHVNRMTYIEYEDPLLTVLLDHTASHIAVVNYDTDLVFFTVRNNSYCMERVPKYRNWGAVLLAYTIVSADAMVYSIQSQSDNATIFSMSGVKLSFVSNRMYKVRAQMLGALFT